MQLGAITVRNYGAPAQQIVDSTMQYLPSNGVDLLAKLEPNIDTLLRTAIVSGRVATPVERRFSEVGFVAHRCLQVTPAAGQTATLTFANFNWGDEVVAYAGLADVFTRRDIREPAEFSIASGEMELAHASLGVDDGWVRIDAPTSAANGGSPLVVQVRSTKARDRLVCFVVESRKRVSR